MTFLSLGYWMHADDNVIAYLIPLPLLHRRGFEPPLSFLDASLNAPWMGG